MAKKFHKYVSMERTPREKAEEAADMVMPAVMDIPNVPHGLCISLTEVELEKLELEDDPEVGDLVHLFCMAKVTSVSKRDTGSGSECRVELSIISMAVEDESTEEGPDDD